MENYMKKGLYKHFLDIQNFYLFIYYLPRIKEIKKAKEFVNLQQKQSVENQERALQALGVNVDLMKKRNSEFLDELHKKLEARVNFYVMMWNLRRRVEV